MEWMFLITACDRTRVESRVLQVLDQHMFSLRSFSSMRMGEDIRITLIAETDPAGAVRLRALLHKLQDVRTVDSFENNHGMCRALALFKILCDYESRLPLLQVVSSLGAQVVSIRPDSVAFQMIGTPREIEDMHASLLPYGLVEAISVGSAAVRKHPVADRPVPLSEAQTMLEPKSVLKKAGRPRANDLQTVELRRSAMI